MRKIAWLSIRFVSVFFPGYHVACFGFESAKLSPLGACLNPPPQRAESIGTNRMKYYLPHELVLISCGKRIDSVQPEKNSISRKGKKKCCTPFSCLGGPNGPTVREQIAIVLSRWTPPKMDVDTNFPWHVQKITVCADSSGEAQDSVWTHTRLFR